MKRRDFLQVLAGASLATALMAAPACAQGPGDWVMTVRGRCRRANSA